MPLAAIATRINTQRMYHRLITALALLCRALPSPAPPRRAMPLVAIATRKQTPGICDRLITALALPRPAEPSPASPGQALPRPWGTKKLLTQSGSEKGLGTHRIK